jgi:hypothetical protein
VCARVYIFLQVDYKSYRKICKFAYVQGHITHRSKGAGGLDNVIMYIDKHFIDDIYSM